MGNIFKHSSYNDNHRHGQKIWRKVLIFTYLSSFEVRKCSYNGLDNLIRVYLRPCEKLLEYIRRKFSL